MSRQALRMMSLRCLLIHQHNGLSDFQGLLLGNSNPFCRVEISFQHHVYGFSCSNIKAEIDGDVVRRLVGYDRYTSKAAYQCLERLYANVRLYVNFFQPTMKLVSKTRNGAKVNKVYDTARTPYQRLLDTGVLTEIKRQELAATYCGLNRVRLLKQINSNLEQLWQLAVRPASLGNRNYDATRRSSVTV
jgi:hypothetical protein